MKDGPELSDSAGWYPYAVCSWAEAVVGIVCVDPLKFSF